MANPNALYLLADHVKLSLLERKRAQALNLQSDSQDGHISRSLDQFRDGLEALQAEQTRLEEAGDEAYEMTKPPLLCRLKTTPRHVLTIIRPTNRKAAIITDALPGLQKQFDDLTSQFHGFSSPSTTTTLTQPNDPTLAEDFAHATSTKTTTTSTHKKSDKTVRFQDDRPQGTSASTDPEEDYDAASAALFNRPYRDDPDAPQGYRDHAAGLETNAQVHAYHSQVLAEQDEQLDRLGESISRQRELSMQIGDELDGQVALLEDQEALVDRHQSRLDRARRQVGRIARAGNDNKSMVIIVALIIILVLIIAITK